MFHRLTKEAVFFYVLIVVLLMINIILTFTNEFGLFDLLTGSVDLAILVFLVHLLKQNFKN